MAAVNCSYVSLHGGMLRHDQVADIEKVKSSLRNLIVQHREEGEINEDLSKMIPDGLSFEEVINIVFEVGRPIRISNLLDYILRFFPSKSLSPLDQIRRAIVEDASRVLNHASIRERLRECGLEEHFAACCDLAYRMNHPHIYMPSNQPVLPSEYTLNFVWINLNPQDRAEDKAENIFGDGLDTSENAECIKDPNALRMFETLEKAQLVEFQTWNKIKQSFLYRISRWADLNPNASINLWFDSALVTRTALNKTGGMIRAISQSRGVNLRLRDVRKLSNLRGELEHCLHPGTPVFFRVDLVKVLIVDHMMASVSAKYSVVSDIDIEPMTPQHMFDQRTLQYLSSSGYVFNRVGTLQPFENSFFIFNREIEGLRENHHKTMIAALANHLEDLRRFPVGTTFDRKTIVDSQFVFHKYMSFRAEMEEIDEGERRKVVQCPMSQFNDLEIYLPWDLRAETFRFVGNSNMPYTTYGRNYIAQYEGPIDSFINWRSETID